MPERVSIAEDCRITPKIRQAIKQKRRELGLTYRTLGDFFHVNWSTFRKWEVASRDRELSCRRDFRKLLNNYLAGKYDQGLLTLQSPLEEMVRSWQSLSPQAFRAMEQFVAAYELCQPHPDLQKSLTQGLTILLRKALKNELAAFEEGDPPRMRPHPESHR